MASHELGVETTFWKEKIADFRYFYTETGSSTELNPVTLVASHDDSIHFTNSTTSVMKPILLGNQEMDTDRTFMVQPAIGCQGINFWCKNQILSSYPSYFHSLGAIYPYELSKTAFEEMVKVAVAFGFNPDELEFVVSHADEDLRKHLISVNMPFIIDDKNTSRYRHHYGHEKLGGRNVNLHSRGNGSSLGNLTLIETCGSPYAWEVSYDSTQIITQLLELTHPMDSYPVQIPLGEETKRRAASDSAIVSAMLLQEGVQPISRGKNGIVRKFLKSYGELSVPELGIETAARFLIRAAFEELVIQDTLIIGQTSLNESLLSFDSVCYWMDRLAKK